MAKIVLVCVDTLESQKLYPPFGIMYLADVLIKHGYEVKLFHDYASPELNSKVIAESKDALFVGFSTMTSPRLKPTCELSQELKKINNNIIVWGGVHSTLTAEETIKNDFVDIIVSGEGEITLPLLADAIRDKKDYSHIPGLVLKDNDGRVINNGQSEFLKELDTYSPRWDLVDARRYIKNGELILIESRGCPSRCSYCYNIAFNKRMWRAHSVDFVVKIINDLKSKHEINTIYFVSDNFVVNKDRALELVAKVNLPWTAEIRADYFTEEFVKAMKNKKCKQLYIGAESGSDKVLKILKKDVTFDQIEKAVKLARSYDINITCAFMIGIPGETEEDRNMTLDKINLLINKYNVDIDGPKFLNPYPGTEIYDICKEQGWEPPKTTLEWANYSRKTYNLPFLTEKEVNKIIKYQKIIALSAYARNRKLVYPLKLIEKFRLQHKITAFPIETQLAYFLIKIKKWVARNG